MGFISFSIGRLRSGASVSADGYTHWLENGQLQSSRLTPSGDDNPLSSWSGCVPWSVYQSQANSLTPFPR